MGTKAFFVLTLILLYGVQSSIAAGKTDKSEVQPNNAISVTMSASQSRQESDISNHSGSASIIDGMGRKVTIRQPVTKIAFSHPATAEALKILDAWEMVVGRCLILDNTVFPNLDNTRVVMSGQNVYELNFEELYSAGTELFLAVDIPVSGFDEMVSRLEPNIPVVALNFHDASQFIANLEKLGIILGKEKEAEAYIRWFNNIVERITSKTGSVPDKQKIFVKTGWGNVDDIHTYSDELPGMSERDEITGCINIAAKLPSKGGWVSVVDQEWLATQEIDVLIIMDFIPRGFGLDIDDNSLIRKHRQQVMSLPAFSGSKAVKNDRVYVMPARFYSTPRFIIQYAYLAKWLHPGLFPDLNPEAIHQEYISRFLRLDFDLSQHGVFVYPAD